MTIKSKDHFWHFRDELLSDVHQWPDEVIHALNTQKHCPCPITLPYARKAEYCTVLPMISKPDCPSQQSACPAETADPNQDVTHPAAGTDFATHLAGTRTDPKARALPAALPHDIQADPPDATGDPPPHRYFKDSIKLATATSTTDSNETSGFPKEGSLLTDHTSDGQVTFFTMLQVTMKNGTNI